MAYEMSTFHEEKQQERKKDKETSITSEPNNDIKSHLLSILL